MIPAPKQYAVTAIAIPASGRSILFVLLFFIAGVL
jgi:hypothetical protein